MTDPDPLALPRRLRLAAQRLYLVAGGDGPGWLEPAAAAVEAGVGLVQLRLKADTPTRRAALVAARERLGPRPLLIVNDDLDAVWNGDGSPLADGVHLGRGDAAALAGPGSQADDRQARARGLAHARERLGPELLLGTSTRTRSEVGDAVRAGVDHVGFGAMAASPTKADSTLADPAELARCLLAHPDLPIFPIGGLHAGNLDLVLGAGCRRAAVSAAILGAGDVPAAVAALLRRLA